MKQPDINTFQQKLGYTFKKPAYILTALTHSSYANEGKKGEQSNERQEFLGDAVLSIVVSDYLFKKYAHLPEGELTKLRAALVCEKALCQYATELGLGEFLLLGRGEDSSDGRKRPSILADAFEAVIAAIYLDGGMAPAKKFVLSYVTAQVQHHAPAAFCDYKTILQEIIQKNPEERVRYVLADEAGPDHDKHFTVEVHLNSNVIGTGEGKSKKDAEQAAAKGALTLMGEI